MVSNFRHLVETLLSKMDTKLKLSDAVITYSTFEGMFLWVCKQDDHRYKDFNFIKSRLSINAKDQWIFGYNNPQVYNMEWDARAIINLDEFNLGTDILCMDALSFIGYINTLNSVHTVMANKAIEKAKSDSLNTFRYDKTMMNATIVNAKANHLNSQNSLNTLERNNRESIINSQSDEDIVIHYVVNGNKFDNWEDANRSIMTKKLMKIIPDQTFVESLLNNKFSVIAILNGTD